MKPLTERLLQVCLSCLIVFVVWSLLWQLWGLAQQSLIERSKLLQENQRLQQQLQQGEKP